MSKYTTQVRWIVETYAENTPGKAGNIEEMLTIAAPKIFNFSYPIWGSTLQAQQANMQELNVNILRHYYMREICAETLALWKLFLRDRMISIMPYYVDLHKSIEKDYDMLIDVNLTETIDRHHDNTDTTQGTQTGTHNETQTNHSQTDGELHEDHATHGNQVRSDFPQAQIGTTDYASDAGETNGTQSANDTSKNTMDATLGTDGANHVEIENELKQNHQENTEVLRKGLSGSRSYAQLIAEYRSNIINIQELIYNELSDLFMQVY